MRVGVGVFTGGPSGVPVSVLETALALHAAGVSVTTFLTDDAELPPGAEALAPSAVRLDAMPTALRSPRVEHALHLPHRLLLGRRLARALAAHRVDVVHVFSPGLAAALPAGPPSVAQSWFSPPTLRGRLGTMMPFAPRTPLAAAHLAAEVQAHAADRLGYRRAGLVLANTRAAEDALRAAGIDALNIPPPIAVPERRAQRSPSPALRLVFCAYNLATPRKGLRLVLDALPAMAPGRMRLTLVGGWSDELEPAVERVRRAGTEVIVRGRVTRAGYHELLARETDLLVMPSLYEEWGYALFEALSLGVPALALPRYPFGELLDASTGILAGAATPEAIAAGLERALAGALPAPTAVQAATRERFGAGAIAPRLVAAYERVVEAAARC